MENILFGIKSRPRKFFDFSNIFLRYIKRNQLSDSSNKTNTYVRSKDYLDYKVKKLGGRDKIGEEFYPHKFNVTHNISDFIEEYDKLEKEAILKETVSIAGRIHAIRENSKNLKFLDVVNNGNKLQVVLNAKSYSDPESFKAISNNLSLADFIGAEGFPMRTKSGELSVLSREVKLLSPCLHLLPSLRDGLINKEVLYRRRYLDLLVNEKSRNVFLTRSKIVSFLRSYLENLGFVEVETPMLSCCVGGAIAKPFTTRHNTLDLDMFLRISPELYLKMVVVGGIDRVFEIGKQFRNEGVDSTHNPEFTTCEFYAAYLDYFDLMDVTEQLLRSMVFEIFGSHAIETTIQEEKIKLNFQPAFKRLSFISTLEEKLGVSLPPPEEFHLDSSRKFIYSLCLDLNINVSENTSTSKLLDKLFDNLVKNHCVQPTFITDFPIIMSPLAKHHRFKPGVSERFELYIANKEICNAYTELNNPIEQRKRFEYNLKVNEIDDKYIDEDFCTALEYGLPPTAGWGLGIDRLVMVLTGCQSIKDVILFPTVRTKDQKEAHLE